MSKLLTSKASLRLPRCLQTRGKERLSSEDLTSKRPQSRKRCVIDFLSPPGGHSKRRRAFYDSSHWLDASCLRRLFLLLPPRGILLAQPPHGTVSFARVPWALPSFFAERQQSCYPELGYVQALQEQGGPLL